MGENFTRIQEVAGVKDEIKVAIANDITPHLFRYTYATSLYYAGVDIKTAQYLLGHSSIAMTMEIYTHLDAINNKVTADKIISFLKPPDVNQSKISQ